MEPRICERCGVEMVLGHKHCLRIIRPYQDLDHCTLDVKLVAFQDRRFTDSIYPGMCICPKCGKLEFFLNGYGLKKILEAEEDNSFERRL